MTISALLLTPLNAAHRASGAKMVSFAGWDMPIHYSKGILAEHHAVREGAGMFDVSHMGRISVDGEGATGFLDTMVTSAIAPLRVGRARYGLICNPAGGVLDDVVVMRHGENGYTVICNAASWDRVLAWLRRHATEQPRAVVVTPRRDETVMIAVQGPKALEAVNHLNGIDMTALRRFSFLDSTLLGGVPSLVSRTGYTGENGYELIVDRLHAEQVWTALIANGVEPCGLGARDTLRLEAGLLLYGQDMDQTTTPLEAGLERFVSLEKEFIGAPALRAQATAGLTRRLAGFVVEGRVSPRHGYPVGTPGVLQAAPAVVTSGGPSPTLGAGIGLAYLPPTVQTGDSIEVNARGNLVHGTVIDLPFYRRGANQ
ncbi:MAG: glycine cleavage system aminomethyltransferase GcvT [Chloroflexi bacterium]|nr:glycine cleavage system aminomethyltransferase GcvT [Chloroflexota bacterium]